MLLVTFCLAAGVTADDGSDQLDYKSPATACWISIGTTVLAGGGSAAMINAGSNGDNDDLSVAGGFLLLGSLTFGPGAGHLYADNTRRFVSGSGMRALFLGVSVTGLGIGLGNAFSDNDDGTETAAGVLFIAGAVSYTGYTFYDLIRAGRSAKEYNTKVDAARFRTGPWYEYRDGTVGVQLSLTL
ncbi:hypothetical protein GF420_15935 [candidate division GN15 bacterium]|nr:hypothetical protein [candidate division GN15 bacterium]